MQLSKQQPEWGPFTGGSAWIKAFACMHGLRAAHRKLAALAPPSLH